MRTCRVLPLLIGLLLPAPGTARAAGYEAQVVLRAGDPAGDLATASRWILITGDLNHRGDLAIVAAAPGGSSDGGALLQYAGGRWTTIAVHGQPGPQGTWPIPTYIGLPIQMNEQGDIVFMTESGRGRLDRGVYRWDFATRAVIPIAVKGMPIADGLTLETVFYTPATNRHGEIVFPARVRTAEGKLLHGILLRRVDGKIETVALSDQELPGGGTLREAVYPAINDAGAVTFLATTSTSAQANSAYLWEQGALTAIVAPGGLTTDEKKVLGVWCAKPNNRDRSVLVSAQVQGSSGFGLYRFAEGKLTPLVVRGQEMPGGGNFTTIDYPDVAISWANEAGQHAFYGSLEGGGRAVYRLDPDGALALVLKNRTATNVGEISHIAFGDSYGIALNNRGQVAVAVRIDNGPATTLLLTPTP